MTRLPALLVAATVALACLAAGAAAVAHRAEVRPPFADDGRVVILAIGSDVGPPHRPGNPLRGRADGVHLIAVDPRARRATIVNIPRDAAVGGTKALAHLAFGGPEQLRDELEAFTGITIDHWALMTFRSVENVVDELGGVDVVIDQPMRDRFSGSDFQPGPTTLAGWQALAYVRDRKSLAGGDFDRSRHHGDLLRFSHRQIRDRHASLAELTRLTAVFARNTVSDIPPSRLLPLALLAVRIDPADVRQVPLGGRFATVGGESVVVLAPGDEFERIRRGELGP